MTTLLSKTAIARRLGIDPRTLNHVLSISGIEPDFVQGPRKLFHATRLNALREQIREAGK